MAWWRCGILGVRGCNPVSDKLGVRKSLLVSVVLYIVGRSALPLAPYFIPLDSPIMLTVVFAGLLLAAAAVLFWLWCCGVFVLGELRGWRVDTKLAEKIAEDTLDSTSHACL